MAERLQNVSGGAEVGVVLGVVAKLVLAEKALLHGRSPLRARHMRRQASLLAGFDILALEISFVGDDIDLLDLQNLASGLGRLLQQAHVQNIV
ncbi:MAG TPA: hypothetical protein VL996_02360 [Methylocella sp.]|nr:hypothetical protein [Methylocella sp.]